MQKFIVYGYSTGQKFYDGSHADCIRWLNHKYQIKSKYGARATASTHQALLPEPMLVISASERTRITGKSPAKITKAPWTPEEECYLRNSFGKNMHQVAAKLPRHTYVAVIAKATKLRKEEAVR